MLKLPVINKGVVTITCPKHYISKRLMDVEEEVEKKKEDEEEVIEKENVVVEEEEE